MKKGIFFGSIKNESFILNSIKKDSITLQIGFSADFVDPETDKTENIEATPKISWMPHEDLVNLFLSFKRHLSHFTMFLAAVNEIRDENLCSLISTEEEANKLKAILSEVYRNKVGIDKITLGGEEESRFIKIDGVLNTYSGDQKITTGKILLQQEEYGFESDLDLLIDEITKEAYYFVCNNKRRTDLFSPIEEMIDTDKEIEEMIGEG